MSPVEGPPRRQVNSFPQRTFSTRKGTSFIKRGSYTAGTAGSPICPLRPAPKAYNCPVERRMVVWDIEELSEMMFV